MSDSSNKANADIQAEVDNNYAAFQVALPDLLTQYRGKFALMRHEKVEGTFDSLEEAVKFAVSEYADNLFSVQEITDATADQGFFSNAVALSAV